MKKLFLVLLLIPLVSRAQVFSTDLPDDFTSISLQWDPVGSFDKNGINTVLTLSNIDFEWLEYELQLQTLFNGDSVENGWTLTYLDAQIGAGVMIPVSSRVAITPGFHGGLIMRPKDVIGDSTYDGYAGFFTYGLTSKLRVWMGRRKRLALVYSCALDRAPDVKGKDVRFNSRGGLEYRFW